MKAVGKMICAAVGVTGFLALAVNAHAAILAEYTFTGSVYTSSDVDLNSVAGSFTAASGISGGSSITTASGSPAPAVQVTANYTASTKAAAVSGNDYYSFVVTPTGGNVLNLDGGNLKLDYARGGNSATINWAVRSSVDSYAADLGTGSTGSTTFQNAQIDFNDTAFNNLDSVQFRLFVWDNSNNANRQVRFDNIQLEGTSAVPEPVHYALGAFGLVFAGVRAGRYYLARRRAA